MWVHSDIIESQQYTTVTHRKSNGKAKVSSSNVVGISTRETEEDVASLTSSREEEFALAADTGTPSTSKTRSGNQLFETVWSAGGKLFLASEGDSRTIHKVARGQTEGTSLYQSLPKR